MEVNTICIDERDMLSQEEIEARDELFMQFNPLLKVALASGNLTEFTSFAFNSCRQSAVFSAKFLKERLPDYTVKVYEGKFNDFLGQQPVEYIHYYTVIEHDDRKILVDMSRTTRKLLFHVINSDDILHYYPEDYGYEQMTEVWAKEQDWNEMFESEGGEYFTKIRPRNLYRRILDSAESLMTVTESRRETFAGDVYGMFTGITSGSEWL